MKISINRSQQLPRFLFIIALFSILAACGGGSTTTPPIVQNDASLQSLSLSSGALSPIFASKVTDYTLSTKAKTTTVTPTVSNAKATVTVNGDATSPTSASAPIDLNVGDNTITLIVTAEDKSTKTYRIIVTRIALSTDANLSNLVLSAGSFNTAFNSNVTDYTLSTKAKTTTVTPTVSDANATVTVDGTETGSASASAPIDLTVGDNTIILIVTAEDKSTKTYRITVTRTALSTDANLSGLVLTAGSFNTVFNSNVTDYTLSTKAKTTTVTPTVSNANATVTVNGAETSSASASAPIDLTVGDNTITLIVTAEDKSTKTYRIIVTRTALSTDANLSGLVLTAGSFNTVFNSNVTDYTLSTKAKTTTVTPTVSDANATVTVDGTETGSASASAPINLTVGDNTITLIVTAEDASTKTYRIIVTRIALSTDANLSGLVLSAGSLTPTFASNVTDYTFTTTTADSATVTPTVSDTKARVTVNGTATSSASTSAPIDLTVGENTITLIVTAEDKSTKTYTIIVNHLANIELINPNTAAGQKFGEKVVQLANGNIIVNVVGNDENKGAVYLYKPTSGTAFASFYGNKAYDQLGSGGIIALANNHFLIVSPFEYNGELNAAGSIKWVNGTTGAIVKTLRGDRANDQLGSGGVHLLDDNTIIINSPNYKNNNITTGAVMLLPHSGDSIKTLYGDNADPNFTTTKLGDKGITLLGNGKFVIVSTEHTNKTFANAGLVQLVNSEGEVLESITGQGQKPNEYFGGSGITPLKNGNFLIATQTHDASNLTNVGAIQLINGDTGDSISTLIGNKKDGYLGKTDGDIHDPATTTITPLGNNNYVVLHHTADNGNITNAGSIRLFNGVSGNEIIFAATTTATETATEITTGTPVFGSHADDFVKQNLYMTKITALKNHNFVVTAPHSDKQSVQSAGSIRLMDGVSGAQLSVQEGDSGESGESDYLGNGDTIELSNGKYVVASFFHSNNGKSTNGSVRVFNHKGEALKLLGGNKALDYLGDGGLTPLGNDKFVIVSKLIQNDSLVPVGSIQLVDASAAIDTQNIKEISGDDAEDFYLFGGVTRLNNHNFVFALPFDDVTVDGANQKTADAGSVQVVNSTGDAVQKILGAKAGDMNSVQMIRPVTAGDYFILSQPLADDKGADSGRVRLVVPIFPTTNN